MPDAVLTPQKGWPRWANKLMVWLGVPTGILLTALALLGALEGAGRYSRSACQSVGLCAVPKPVPPTLPNYTSPWVDGGHNAAEYCEPQAQHYRDIYPGFNITWKALGEGRDKVGLGHAIYQYNCAFVATSK
jgi:hypothetical protein